MFSSVVGRTVLVTGGTKGIGKGIARVFARSGANVVVVARNAEVGESCAQELSALGGGPVAFVAADVATPLGCQTAVDAALEWYGGLDVLCANAGIFPDATLAEMTEADLDTVLGTNVKGTVFSVQAALDPL